MELVTQFSIFLVNKPGALAQVTQRLAAAKVNVLAMTMMDSSENGVLRLVSTDDEKTRHALADLNMPMTQTEVLTVEMPNKAGSLADVCEKLAKAHINIAYAYLTTGAKGGKAKGIFKVADTKKAIRTLTPKGHKSRDMNHKLRRPAVLR